MTEDVSWIRANEELRESARRIAEDCGDNTLSIAVESWFDTEEVDRDLARDHIRRCAGMACIADAVHLVFDNILLRVRVYQNGYWFVVVEHSTGVGAKCRVYPADWYDRHVRKHDVANALVLHHFGVEATASSAMHELTTGMIGAALDTLIQTEPTGDGHVEG